MAENLFEAWGAVQGSLQRLGDAVVADFEADRIHVEHQEEHGWVFPVGDPRVMEQVGLHKAAEAAKDAVICATTNYYEAWLHYQELRGKK